MQECLGNIERKLVLLMLLRMILVVLMLPDQRFPTSKDFEITSLELHCIITFVINL